MKSKFLRLLTFLCFFQFSGINNGYTILTSASPLNADQSAACLTQTLQDIHASIQPRTVLPLLQAGQGWVVSMTLRSENAIRNFFRDGRETLQPEALQIGSGVRTGFRSEFDARGTLALGMKEIYTNFEKESWSKREGFSDEYLGGSMGAPQSARNGSEMTARSEGGRGFERFDLAWKRLLTRRFGSTLTGDDAAKIYITRSRI